MQEHKIFRVTSDGWFTFWVCRVCGKKIQLTIDSTPLPDECPYCNASSRKCPCCGTYNFIDKFCSECGARLDNKHE